MFKKGLAASVLASVIVFPSLALAGGDVPFESLPEVVKATVLREVKSGRIVEIESDKRRGQPIYEVEFVDANVKWELDIAIDGTLLSRRED